MRGGDDMGNPDQQTLESYVKRVANEKGVDPRVALAVLKTETGQNPIQFDKSGSVFVSGQDYGLFQINKPSWGDKYDWDKISNDWRYNVQAGIDILKSAWDTANRDIKGTGLDPMLSVYSAYNAGDGNYDRRTWKSSKDWPKYDVDGNKVDDRDENYQANLQKELKGYPDYKPWTPTQSGQLYDTIAKSAPVATLKDFFSIGDKVASEGIGLILAYISLGLGALVLVYILLSSDAGKKATNIAVDFVPAGAASTALKTVRKVVN